ncbi:fat-body protein 1 [Scaptodrosophila lebanonensis]|uniref:Fat-body protein 1 n=1 Tax=Drosophila lebanonensis TaxID=7225 RepID=A0A6J2TAB7_DROLE|nr:fat-body protein 1 [Scaptodrosophila lebanonensis]
MTQEELQRQKFLLDILHRVQQPLQQIDLIRLDRGLIEDDQHYHGGIDAEMKRIIELDRQRRLLDQHQIYSIRDEQHVRQLRGLYRLLVRSDWPTLQRNLVYLRRNINPALLVNVLSLVIRDRADTQSLIMPAIQEVLPQQYVDEQVVQRVQHIGQQQSVQPNLLDVIGMGQTTRVVDPVMRLMDRTQLWMPWRQLRMQMALRRAAQQGRLGMSGVSGVGTGIGSGSVVVLPMDTKEQGMSLLTEDIGMRNFVQGLVNELALREKVGHTQGISTNNDDDEQQQLERLGQLIRQNGGRLDIGQQGKQLFRSGNGIHTDDYETELRDQLRQLRVGNGIGLGMGMDNEELSTTDVNNKRLLRVNRRRLQQDEDVENQNQRIGGQLDNERERFLRVLRRDNDEDEDEMKMQMRGGRIGLERNIGQGIGMGINRRRDLPTVDVNSDRLLRVGRRRQNMLEQQQGNGIMGIVRGDRFSEGRRVGEQKQKDQKSILGDWIDLDVMQGMTQQQQQQQQGKLNVRGQKYGDVKQRREQKVEQQHGGIMGNRMNQQENIRQQQERQQLGMYNNDDLERFSNNDDRLLYINRRRLQQQQEQEQQQEQQHMPRRVGTIGEGRRVGATPLEDEDIMQLIRRDNRLNNLSDDEIIQMLQRNRQTRRMQEQKRQQSSDEEDEDERDRSSIQQGRRMRRSLNIVQDQQHQQQQVINSRRNEILLHTIQQLVARLNQERISLGQNVNDLQLNGNLNVQRLNNPRLINNIDERFALRLNDMRLDSIRNRALLEQINDIERRLNLVIDQLVRREVDVTGRLGQLTKQREMDRVIGDVLLGRLGQVGILDIIRELLQNDMQQVGQQEDRLGLGVSLNDPVVQHILRRIVAIVDQQREQQLGSYQREDLRMDGVTINDVRMDKLRTRIDNIDMDLSNLLEQDQEEQQRVIIGRQRRLNNKAFNIEMDITSQRPQPVVIRMLLGPRTDALGRELTLDERRNNFVVLDTITTQLQTGRNRILRRSNDISWTTRDATPATEIYRRVMMALNGQTANKENIELIGENGRFPQRLLLPRGRPEGLPMQLLVIVSPVDEHEQRMGRIGGDVAGVLTGRIGTGIDGGIGISSVNQDNRPLGYPLDRPIENERVLLDLPNVSVQDVVIIEDN